MQLLQIWLKAGNTSALAEQNMSKFVWALIILW